ncbi:hypothetical protein Droror1_Dr00007022 [Drosera rotundifolia]
MKKQTIARKELEAEHSKAFGLKSDNTDTTTIKATPHHPLSPLSPNKSLFIAIFFLSLQIHFSSPSSITVPQSIERIGVDPLVYPRQILLQLLVRFHHSKP